MNFSPPTWRMDVTCERDDASAVINELVAMIDDDLGRRGYGGARVDENGEIYLDVRYTSPGIFRAVRSVVSTYYSEQVMVKFIQVQSSIPD